MPSDFTARVDAALDAPCGCRRTRWHVNRETDEIPYDRRNVAVLPPSTVTQLRLRDCRKCLAPRIVAFGEALLECGWSGYILTEAEAAALRALTGGTSE